MTARNIGRGPLSKSQKFKMLIAKRLSAYLRHLAVKAERLPDTQVPVRQSLAKLATWAFAVLFISNLAFIWVMPTSLAIMMSLIYMADGIACIYLRWSERKTEQFDGWRFLFVIGLAVIVVSTLMSSIPRDPALLITILACGLGFKNLPFGSDIAPGRFKGFLPSPRQLGRRPERPALPSSRSVGEERSDTGNTGNNFGLRRR